MTIQTATGAPQGQAGASVALEPGDHVQVSDRKSGYSGCILDFIREERGWLICRNDTCPKFFTAGVDGRIVGAIRVRSVEFWRKGVR